MPSNGAQFVPPPVDLRPAIERAIRDAAASIPPGKTAALVTVANEHGANAAFVAKVADSWEVMAWVGKTWKGDPLSYGAAVRAVLF